jgi:hypothetical protein
MSMLENQIKFYSKHPLPNLQWFILPLLDRLKYWFISNISSNFGYIWNW